MARSKVFEFPNPVNEVSARLVAGGVVAMCLAVLFGGQHWVLVPLAYGFLARVAAGPTFSPLGRFVTQFLTPRLPFTEKLVAGPPKRFAQGIGATLSVSALLVWVIGGYNLAVTLLIGAIAIAASLESFLGYCLGCKIFALLMKAGLVSETVCLECADISLRRPSTVSV